MRRLQAVIGMALTPAGGGLWEPKRMNSKSQGAKNGDSRQMVDPGELDQKRAFLKAHSVLRPTTQAAATIKEFCQDFDDLDLHGLVLSLAQQTKASSNGDQERAEAMLAAQAHTLEAIFNHLARCAVNAEHMDNLDRYLKLALRAQSQCRTTWEAQVTIKNPPVMGYIRQANIAHGPQQVNNASDVKHAPEGGRKSPNPQNKLLEEKDGERLDTGAACTSGRAGPAMATVGEVDGAKDPGGQI